MATGKIEYQHDGVICEGYAAYADGGKRPGVLVVHEWNGVSDHPMKRAEMLSDLGYNAFCADIYGKGIRPTTQEACAAEAGKYWGNRPLLRARTQAALDQLRKLPGTDTSKIAAIGYCFGGLTVLELARAGADVSGVVSFHGVLSAPLPATRPISARVLVCHGADDPLVPEEQVLGFEKEMREAKADWQLISYGNAVHSFTNWTLPEYVPGSGEAAAYTKKADQRSWIAMQNFLKEIFA